MAENLGKESNEFNKSNKREELIRERRIDLIRRMVKGYNKNKEKIANKPEQPELSQSEKRKRKLADLISRSNSWKGLENFDSFTGENQ